MEKVTERSERYGFTDANHYGVLYVSDNEDRLTKFSELLSEEGACVSKIRHYPKDTNLIICDIDKEWSGSENINPFYFWYYEN